MKIIASLLSIILLWLLGLAGEGLLNLVHASGLMNAEAPLPAVTAFVIHNYPLNAGHFGFSLTPFMVLLLGAVSLSSVRRSPPEASLNAQCMRFALRS